MNIPIHPRYAIPFDPKVAGTKGYKPKTVARSNGFVSIHWLDASGLETHITVEPIEDLRDLLVACFSKKQLIELREIWWSEDGTIYTKPPRHMTESDQT